MAWLIAALSVLILLAAGVLWYFLYRAGHPQHHGARRLRGLTAPVTVRRDTWGVPHIQAQNLMDLFRAQGYVHAQDRLWQMELNRRVGAGRLSELFGHKTLEGDRFLRRMGLRQAAEADWAAIDAETRKVLEAYAAGVNAFLAQNRLPLELRILGHKPEPWTPVDSLTWGKVMAMSLTANWEAQLLRAWLVEQAGPEWAAELESRYPEGQPLIVPPGAVAQRSTPLMPGAVPPATAASLAEIRRLLDAAAPYLSFGTWGTASNNWVVSGKRTVTGKPLLANDPHLQLGQPSIWYECHLTAPGLDVAGASFAGTPGIVIGQNQHIAWGVTNSQVDVQDLYIERFHPQQPGLYEFRGEWLQAEHRVETIKVKGQADHTEEIWVTHHGPVLTPAVGLPKDAPALALRWTAHLPGTLTTGMLRLNTASNWGEFLGALELWDVPGQNFVYADVDGNVGYTLTGRIPIRTGGGQSLVPVPGWTGEHEWAGFIPWDELPRCYNPDTGYIVTANNKIVDDAYPYSLGHSAINGFRAQRIIELIEATPKHDLDSFARMQNDVCSLPARELLPTLRKLPGSGPAWAALRSWDGVLSEDSAGAAVYEVMLLHLARTVFAGPLGRAKGSAPGDHGPVHRYLSYPFNLAGNAHPLLGRPLVVLLRLLRERPAHWPLPAAPDGSDPWEFALRQAVVTAEAELHRRLGAPDRWRWGRLHTATLGHPMGAVKLLRPIFNVGPFPVPGDGETVLQAGIIPHAPYASEAWMPSYRQVCDLSDLSQSRSVYPGGQAAHPGHRHYADLLPLWRRGELHPMVFAEDDVRRHTIALLQLLPPDTTR